MKARLATIALLVGLARTKAPGQTVPASPSAPYGSNAVAAGHVLFNRTCTGCHGTDGAEGERGPALVGDRRFFRLSESALFETIKGGIPGTAMPPMGLPDDEIHTIVSWIRAMRSSASEADVPGNAAHGAEIFAGKGGCEKCHMLDGKGGTIGSDLSNIGAQITLKHLQASLTEQRPIPDEYRPVKVVTRKGETVEGIAKNEDAFSVQILDYDNKLHCFDIDQLRTIVNGKTSLMPHNYDKVLTPEEYKDLVAMLARQVQNNLRLKRDGDGEIGR